METIFTNAVNSRKKHFTKYYFSLLFSYTVHTTSIPLPPRLLHFNPIMTFHASLRLSDFLEWSSKCWFRLCAIQDSLFPLFLTPFKPPFSRSFLLYRFPFFFKSFIYILLCCYVLPARELLFFLFFLFFIHKEYRKKKKEERERHETLGRSQQS